jgi:hypothetical protein
MAVVPQPGRLPDDPDLFSFTISGEGLTPGLRVQYLVSALGTRGTWITPPFDDNVSFEPGSTPPAGQLSYTLLVANENTIMISEVMASNASYGFGEDNPPETPDWIELYNYGPRAISLDTSGLLLTVKEQFADREAFTYAFALASGERVIFLADEEDNSGPHLGFRLSRSGERLRLVLDLGDLYPADVDRLNFGLLQADQSYGRLGSGLLTPRAILREPTPWYPNPQGQLFAWFVGDPPVWALWGDDPNPAGDQSVVVVARVAWDSAWLGNDAPPEDVPFVLLHWGVGDLDSSPGSREELDLVTVMERSPTAPGDPVAESYTFRAELEPFPAGTVVRYIVEAQDRNGASLWHSAGGVAGDPARAGSPHAFAVGYEGPGLEITEVGLADDSPVCQEAGLAVYREFAADDGSGMVKRRGSFVELHNPGEQAVSLEGMFLSIYSRCGDGPAFFSEGWQITGDAVDARQIDTLTIDPGSYLVVRLDGAPPLPAGVDTAPPPGGPSVLQAFLGGTITLSEPLENGNGTIARFSFPRLRDWVAGGAFGTTPDEPDGRAMDPSPGRENPRPPRLFLNEIFVWSPTEQWIELYNAGGSAVPLAGLKLSNNSGEISTIESSSVIEGGGYAVVVCGGGTGGDATCSTSFRFDRDGVFLEPSDDWPYEVPIQNSYLDWAFYQEGIAPPEPPYPSVTYWPTPPAGMSLSRVPDADRRFEACTPTPGGSNAACAGITFIRGDCNEDGVLDTSRDPASNTDYRALLDVLDGAVIPRCEDRCDINDDGQLGVSDQVAFLQRFLYADPPNLPPPFPDPGVDPTEDGLVCEP